MRTASLARITVLLGSIVAFAAAPAGQGTTAPRERLLWDRAIELWGTTTRDGRLLSFPDWTTGDLGVRDLVSGENRRVTDKGGYVKAEGKVEATAISPDGKRVAFAWEHVPQTGPDEFDLRVIDIDGKGERILVPNTGIAFAEVQEWSPDGKWIAATAQYRNVPGGRILLLPADGSPARAVVTLTERSPMMVRFSPDGRWLAFHAGSPGVPVNAALMPPRAAFTTRQQSVYVVAADGASGEPIQVAPDANLMGWTPDGAALLFRRERYGLMELHLVPMANGRAAGDAQKIHTVTSIGHALSVTPDGRLIHGRGKRYVEAMFASLDPATGAVGPLEASRPVVSLGPGGLGGGVRFSPDGRHVMFTTTASSILLRSGDGAERTLIPQMTRIGRVEWSADGTSLLIAGTADAGKEGVYRVDLQSGAATLLFAAPSVSLLASSPSGDRIYYRSGQGAVIERQVANGTERQLLTPEINAFDMRISRDGSTLAVVGQAALTFVALETGAARVRHAHSRVSGDKFWGGDWTADGSAFLASVSVARAPLGPKELWTLRAGGGEPVRQPIPVAVRGVSISRDGTQVALMRAESLLQVWALENFLPRTATSRAPR